MKIHRTALLALFTAIALTIFMLEGAIPPPVPVPGIKLGLANVITLLLLVCMRPSDAFIVLLLRIVLGSIFGGQMISFIYSMSGGIVCFVTMWGILRFLHQRFLPLVSVCGALAHNITQIAAAVLLTSTPGIIAYLPLLILSGCVTGLFTGLCAQAALHYLRPLLKSHLK